MSERPSRRQVLAAIGGSAAAVSLATGTASAEDPCEGYFEAEAELEEAEARLAELDTTLADATESHESLLTEVTNRYREVRGPAKFAESTMEEALEVSREIREAVVFLDMHSLEYGNATATAWFSDDGVLVTNAHNVDDVDTGNMNLEAWTYHGEKFTFEVIDYVSGRSPDVATLETDIDPPATITFGTSHDLSPGDPLVQVGHPGSFGHWVTTIGELEEIEDEGGRDVLKTTIPGLSGVSGSPVVDLNGDVVGLTYGASGGGQANGEAPKPASTSVQQYPLQVDMTAEHERIETVESTLEGWL